MNRAGTHIAFTSFATNLVSNAANGGAQVYLRDLVAGTTLLVSSNPDGSAGGADAQSPAMSEDGSVIAFVVGSDGNYGAGDTNGFPDVFVRNLVTGITQLASSSALTPQKLVLAIAPASNGQFRVTWPVEAGKNYRVQFSVGLRELWSDVAVNSTIENGIASVLIAPGTTAQSFYRVAVTP